MEPSLTPPETLLGIAGWGVVDPRVIRPPDFLHVGTARARSAEYCYGGVRNFVGEPYTPALQLCLTGAPGFHNVACYGDSGGPAIAHGPGGVPIEVGVFSLVGEDCAPQYPTVYTRVDRISGWVRAWIASVEEGGAPPSLRVQHVHVPFLSFERAKEIFNFGKLAEALPNRLQGRRRERSKCARLAPSRVSCRVRWVRGDNYFYGHITTSFVLRGDEVPWGERYVIHWTRRGCQSGIHCAVRTLSGRISPGQNLPNERISSIVRSSAGHRRGKDAAFERGLGGRTRFDGDPAWLRARNRSPENRSLQRTTLHSAVLNPAFHPRQRSRRRTAR
jgi:hypothetical protein